MTTTLVLLLALPWLLWALYVMVMGVYRAHLDKRLTTTTKVLAAPWVAFGFAVDIAVNIAVASLLFIELPEELLVTKRLQRHLLATTGWRCRLARWICVHMLDLFDPTGKHC